MYSAAVQVSREDRQAHVILATSDSGFIAWLTESGYLDFSWLQLAPTPAGAHIAAHAFLLGATAELGSQCFETQVIGNFPEAEARLYLEQSLRASVTDAEWAAIFEVRVQVSRHHSLLCRLMISYAVRG